MDWLEKWKNNRFLKSNEKTNKYDLKLIEQTGKKYRFFNWTNQSFQRILKINLVFYWTTYFFGTNFLKKRSFFYWTYDFIEKMILLNETFYWTNDFSERSFSELRNEIYGKWPIILRKNKTNFFKQLKKTRTKSIIHEQWTNKMKKSWTLPSLPVIVSVYVPSGLVTLKYIYKLTNDKINLSTVPDW